MPDNSTVQFLPDWAMRAGEGFLAFISAIGAGTSLKYARDAKETAALKDHEMRIAALEREVARNYREIMERIGRSESTVIEEIRTAFQNRYRGPRE